MTDTMEKALELTIVRDFDAPRDLVYAAWTQPEQLAQWLGPHGFTAHSIDGDLRPGGSWRSAIRADDGVDLWSSGVYSEVEPPERLAFTYAWEEPAGTRGFDSLVTITFDDLGNDRTRMTFRQEGFENEQSRDGHHGGWDETFSKLAAYVAR